MFFFLLGYQKLIIEKVTQDLGGAISCTRVYIPITRRTYSDINTRDFVLREQNSGQTAVEIDNITPNSGVDCQLLIP